VAAIASFVELLEDQDLSAEERRAILARIGSTAWSMDLAVGNVLDLYQFQEGHIPCAPIALDPNRIVADAASNCGAQAARRGLRLTTDFGVLPHAPFDPRHLERIARNLIAYSISRLKTGEIALRTYPRDGAMMMEVEDTGPAPPPEELSRILAGPDATGVCLRSATLGLYVARTLAERTGGRIEAKISDRGGLKFIVELRPVPPEPKPGPA
jgi:signal transduction histidine kinase